MFLFRSPESLIADLAGQVEFYLNIASPDGMRHATNDAVDRYNTWVRAESVRLETEKAGLDRLKTAIDAGQRRSESGTGGRTVEGLIKEWNRKLPEYNARVETFNKTSALQRTAIEAAQKSMTRDMQQCQRWLNRNGSLKLSISINRLFGRLLAQRRERPADAARLNPLLDQLRSMRAGMARHTTRTQSLSATGMLVVQGRLENEAKDGEECWFMIDNGCSSSVFSPEMVHAMDLDFDDRAKILLKLANGAVIKAPPCAVPGVTVNGCRAQFVKGVVLRETTPGLDGSLGMSFLSRFDFSIQKGAPQRLVLQSPPPPARTSAFDVFICFNTEDSGHARLVYAQLSQRGYRPFFSLVSAPGHGTEGSILIDRAVESARHMVLICSKASPITAPYVKAEWGLFDGLKRAGRKSGNIVPVLFEGMTPNKLPAPLSLCHSIIAQGEVEDWIGLLTGFLPRH